MVNFGRSEKEQYFNSREMYLLSHNESDITAIGNTLSDMGVLLFNFDLKNIEMHEKKSMLLIDDDCFSEIDKEMFENQIQKNHFVFSYAQEAKETIFKTEGHVTLPLNVHDVENMISNCEQKVFYESQIENLEKNQVALERISELGRFAGSLVHDLNNYNTICMTAFDGIKLVNHKKIQNERVEFLVSKGLKGCDMINSISQKYRRYMYVEQEAEKNFFPLELLINEALSCCEKDLNQYRITYKIEVSRKLQLLCDSTSFIQVLVNLISNSVFEIKNKENPWISIKTRDRKASTFLYIVDSGEGIAKEIQSRIFDPLFSTKAQHEGTGFGLNFALLELKKMGMKLRYVDNKNTAFSIEIPTDLIKD